MSAPIIPLISEIDALNEAKNIAMITINQHCTEMIKDIISYSPDSYGDLLKLKSHVVKLAESQKEIDAIIHGIHEVDTLTDKKDVTGEEAIKKFEKSVNEFMEENDIDDNQKEIISSLESFINDEQELNIGKEDNELLVTKATESYKDPLTQLTMKDPVKSKICNHSYEKGSILAYIGESKKKCPYSGCQKMLGRNDLVENFALKMKLSLKGEEN